MGKAGAKRTAEAYKDGRIEYLWDWLIEQLEDFIQLLVNYVEDESMLADISQQQTYCVLQNEIRTDYLKLLAELLEDMSIFGMPFEVRCELYLSAERFVKDKTDLSEKCMMKVAKKKSGNYGDAERIEGYAGCR